MNIQTYEPSAVLVPNSSSVQRIYPQYSEISHEYRQRLDFKTVFYDVFLDEFNRCLIGLGPPLLNLKKDAFPMSVYVGDQKLNYRLRQIKDVVFFETDEIKTNLSNQVDVVFCFKDFSNSITVGSCTHHQPFSCDNKHRLTLTTLQKDNPIAWISDWITWYHRSYGVTRLILYDNSSESWEEVLDFLNGLPFDMEVVFVNWPYPHGFHPYKYCQKGSLNHCRIRFSISSGYCLNFDIDEYLMYSEGKLLDLLNDTIKYPKPGAIAITQTAIPDVPPSTSEKLLRCWHYKFRNSSSGYKGELNARRGFGKTKYIYRFDDIGYNGVHSTASERAPKFRARYPNFTFLVFLIRKVFWELTKKTNLFKSPKPRIDMVHADISEITYLHFYGLHTGWSRHGGVEKSPVTLDLEKHEIEPRIKQIKATVKV